MTLNGAIMQLVEIRNNPMCPVIFKPALNKVIETISELEEKLIETISEPEEEPQPSKDAIAGRIEQLPPAQLGTNLAEVGTDCISRQAAIDICANAIDLWRGQLGEGALIAVRDKIKELPPAQQNLSEEYAKAVRNWLVNYQIKCVELKGRYTPYEVLGWIVSDWRKEMEYGDNISRQADLDALNHELRCGAVINQCGLEEAYEVIEGLPPVTPKQSLDIDKVSKEVLNAISKWLDSQDDKRNVLDVIKDVLQPHKGKE